jgi:hypothetical protein
MKIGQPKPADELRMSSKEFDRIMGRALRVRPQEAHKVKMVAKATSKAPNKTAHKMK